VVQKAGPLSPSRPKKRSCRRPLDSSLPKRLPGSIEVCEGPRYRRHGDDRVPASAPRLLYSAPEAVAGSPAEERPSWHPHRVVAVFGPPRQRRAASLTVASTTARLCAVGPQPAHHEPSNSSDAGPSKKARLRLRSRPPPHRGGSGRAPYCRSSATVWNGKTSSGADHTFRREQ
jgi:hypothetical protein